MSEQNLRLVNSYPRTFTQQNVQAAQIGLVGTDKGDEGKYVRLSRSETDLPDFSFDQVRKKAFYLWQRNPLAKRVLEILNDFCTGDDLVVKIKTMKREKSGDKEIKEAKEGQQIWDDFFEDPINNLEEDDSAIQMDGFINGELALPVFVNPSDGSVRLGYIAPQNIKDVVPLAKNQRVIDKIKVMPFNGTIEETINVVRWNYEGNANDSKYGKLVGDVLFFQLNRIPSQLRGYSILIDHIDWLDAFDQFLFSTLQGFDARSRYFYDLQMNGKTQDELDAMVFTPPANGAVNAHNEEAKWQVITPDLKAADSVSAVKMVKEFICGTMGLPVTWLGEGDSTNRATAESLTVPTMRMLKRMQGYTKRRHKFTAKYILQCAQEKNPRLLAPDEYFDIEVSTFNLGAKDIETTGAGFTQMVNALAIAETKGWVSSGNAKKLVDGILNAYGVESEEQETPEEILAKNKDKQEKKSYERLPQPPQFQKEDLNKPL
ncbi:MAG: hypothetical protein IMZ53_13060 [Thermoplasmata archaeon]|nr:hypothetical protein [Thermoplasmata archaeon]